MAHLISILPVQYSCICLFTFHLLGDFALKLHLPIELNTIRIAKKMTSSKSSSISSTLFNSLLQIVQIKLYIIFTITDTLSYVGGAMLCCLK